jgi:hypothetical protein
VSVSAVLYPRWPPFKKIEMVKIGKSSKFIKNPIIMLKSSSLCLCSSNLGTFWVKIEQLIVSVSAILYPRWPPLKKIEISSNGQNCSILTQKVPKFELHKHNDELFNIFYGILFLFLVMAAILDTRRR